MNLYTTSSDNWEDWTKKGRSPTIRGKSGKRMSKPRPPRELLKDIIIDTIDTSDKRSHCYLIGRHYSSEEVRKMSAGMSGSIWYMTTHFVHESGGLSETYVLDTEWPNFGKTVATTKELTGWDHVGFTPTQIARRVDKYLQLREPILTPEQRRVILPSYNFTYVRPGTYPYMYHHDIKGAYWQLLKKAPSPRIRWDFAKNRMLWINLEDDEWIRWVSVLERFENHKAARNALVGSWTAGYNGKRDDRTMHFVRGKLDTRGTYRPPALSTIGHLVVRLCYEITQEQCLMDRAVYAWVDCVMSPSPTPLYWKKLGLQYHKATMEGELDLYTFDTYTIGEWIVSDYDWEEKGEKITWNRNGRPIELTMKVDPPKRRSVYPYLLPRRKYMHQRVLDLWNRPW